jgi:uncharacterized protein involved in exopolysaccharide biosynthesis
MEQDLFSSKDAQLSPTLEPTAPGLRQPHFASDTRSTAFPDQGSSLSLLTIAEACFRHRTRLLLVAGLTMAITLAAAFLMPKRYQANMQLLVLNAREDSVISPEAGELIKPEAQITDSDVNSQAELLRSRDVLNEALDQLGRPNVPAAVRDQEIERLSRGIDTAPVRQSNILNVSYVDSSPEAARQVLQALAASFVQKELSLRRPARSREVFQQLVNKSRKDLSLAETTLASFKVETGIAALTEDEAALLRQLEGTSTQTASLEAEIAELHRREERTQAELADHPERIATQSRSTPNQKAVEDLTIRLVDLENQRTALLARYQPGEPNVVEIEKQIETVRTEISHQGATSAVETTTDVNPLAQDLKTDLAKVQITSAALKARRATVESENSQYLKKLDSLEDQRARYDSLQKDVIEAQHNYDLAVQKRDEAAFDDALDRERILNVAFAASPSASSIPIAPKPKMYIALGIFSAMFLGIGSCVIGEMTRSVVYSPADLDAVSGVLTLATVPMQAARLRGERLAEPEAANPNLQKFAPTGVRASAKEIRT